MLDLGLCEVERGKSLQVSWIGDNVQGHAIDEQTGEIDETEGFGAFENVLEHYAVGSRVIDIGGGAYDLNKAYIAHRYLLDCEVYDPFKRSVSDNQHVLSISQKRPFNAAFSFSVLNVINSSEARLDHIRLCQKVLKVGGKAFFKVWPGDSSERAQATKNGYQNNRHLETYLEELKTVFGTESVIFDEKLQLVCAINRLEVSTKGSMII